MNDNRFAGARIGMTPRATTLNHPRVNHQWAVSGPAILAWVRRAGGWCALAAARRHQRIALQSLDDRLLRDIGKTRQEAEAEAAKPFWR